MAKRRASNPFSTINPHAAGIDVRGDAPRRGGQPGPGPDTGPDVLHLQR
jgi:hypothetical protein